MSLFSEVTALCPLQCKIWNNEIMNEKLVNKKHNLIISISIQELMYAKDN